MDHSKSQSFFFCSQRWLATVQDVLQADWHEVWHSPQPPPEALCFSVAPLMVRMCFMTISSCVKHVKHVCLSDDTIISNG
jgi:hypothetical protein